MIEYPGYDRFLCGTFLSFAGNQSLTKQKMELLTNLHRKNIVFQVVVLMVCTWLMGSQWACAEDWMGFQLAENEHVMSYQANGDILCSALNQEGQLTAIKKLNHDGELQWTHKFSEPYVQGTLLFRAIEDELGFALCGKLGSTGQYEAILIGTDGLVQSRGILSSSYKLWAMTDTGILFSSPHDEGDEKNTIWYVGWDGKQSSGVFSGKIVDVRNTITVGNYVFLNAVYERQDFSRVASILAMDLETGNLSNADIGNEGDWSIQSIGKSRENGIIAVACRSSQREQRVVQIAPSGKIQWATTLYSDLYGPVAQIVRPCGSDHYEIWGTAGVLDAQEEYPKRFTTYRMELGKNGELLDSMIGTYSGDCVEYKDTQVYVVDVDESNYVSLDTFKADSRASKAYFYATAEE